MDDANYLRHPEVFVNKCACSDERRAVLDEMSCLLAVILDVTAVYIEEKDAPQYLFASSVTRREVREKSAKTSGYDLWTTNEIEGFERGVIALGWSNWAEIARQFVTSRDRIQVCNHAMDIHPEKKKQLLREHEESKPPDGIEHRKWAPWTTDEIEGFERGVIALGWSHWAEIARRFVPSLDRIQVKNYAKKIHPEKKEQLLREHDAIPAFNESNKMPHLSDTTSMNNVASSCYTPPTKFDEPENEQIEIVEV
jgi:hypothetical protein